MPTKFQERTAMIKFFRDLSDRQIAYKTAFEQRTTPLDDLVGTTVYSYDIRKEATHNLKDEADRNLLYNITQFLLDSRALLATRVEEQRVRSALPEAADFLRVCDDIEALIAHFNVKRAVRRRNGSSAPSTGSERDDSSFAIGIDQATFVDVFSQALAQETARVLPPPVAPSNEQPQTTPGSLSASQSCTISAGSPLKASTRKMSRSMSTVGGRSERRALIKLFDAMDVDDCGVVSWDNMIGYMARVRLGGQDLVEVQREGELTLSSSIEVPAARVGSGKAATSGSVHFIAAINAVMVLSQIEDDRPQPGGGRDLKHCEKFLDLFSATDFHLMHRRPLPLPTVCAVYVPLKDESGSAGFFGSFTSAGTFQAYRVQLQLSRGTLELVTVNSPIQLPKGPAMVLYNGIADLVFGATLQGELVGYDPASLNRPNRLHTASRLHQIFTEPITCMIQSQDETVIFLSCLFGGIAVYAPLKRVVTHQFTATVRGETVGIRTMAYLPQSSVLITGGPSSVLHMWMSAPNKNMDPHVGSLRHDSDPHAEDMVSVWVDPSVSTYTVASLDRRGTMKLWDLKQTLCMNTFTVGDGLGYHVFSAIPGGSMLKGQLYFLGNSTRTHRCLLDRVILSRKLINPIAVARREGTNHHASLALVLEEEQALSAVDGSVMTYEIKSGKMLRFLPNVCGPTDVITAMAPMCNAKKVLVGTQTGQIASFVLSSGERSISFRSFPRGCEVSGLVVVERQNVLVACSKQDKGNGGALRLYSIPDRVDESDLNHHVEYWCELAIPGGLGIPVMCERSYVDTCAVLVLWDERGRMHQVSVEGARVLMSSLHAKRGASTATQGIGLPTAVDGHEEHGAVSASEINFATETSILRLLEHGLEDAEREMKCATDLSPFAFVASADSASKLHLWTAAPHELSKVKSWEHFSPRQVVDGVNKAVVTAMTFRGDHRQLITVDDHGCLCVWAMAVFLDAAADYFHAQQQQQRTPTVESLGDVLHGGRRRLDGELASSSVTSSSAGLAASYADAEIRLLHCFHVTTGVEPLVRVHRMVSVEAYCVGLAYGTTRFVSLTGSVVGELFPDPKHMLEAPPRYFVNDIAQVEEIKRPKKRTRAGELWAKLRNNVLGEGRVIAMSVKELVSRARNAVDFALGDAPTSPNAEGNESAALASASPNATSLQQTPATMGATSRRQVFRCHNTPCNTPTRVQDVDNTLRVSGDISKSENLIRSAPALGRHPVGAGRSTLHQRRSRRGTHALDASLSCDDNDPPSPISGGSTDDALCTLQAVHAALERLCALEGVASVPGGAKKAVPFGGESSVKRCDGAPTAVSLARYVPSAPMLFPPSVFKALRRPELGLPPAMADRPVTTPRWMHVAIKSFEAANIASSLSAPSTPGGGARVWRAHCVPQPTMPLQVLNMRNMLFVKYWQTEEDAADDGAEPGQGKEAMHGSRCTPMVESSDAVKKISFLETSMTIAERGASMRRRSMRESQRTDHHAYERAMVGPSELRVKLCNTPTSLADALRVGGKGEASEGQGCDRTSLTANGDTRVGQHVGSCSAERTLEALLHASAPMYPLQESPYLDPGRPPPALGPALFHVDGLHARSRLDDISSDGGASRCEGNVGTDHDVRSLSSCQCSGVTGRPSSTLSSAMRRLQQRHAVSRLHANFMKLSLAELVPPADVGVDDGAHQPLQANDAYRWDVREASAKQWGAQFNKATARPASAASVHGRIAKLRLSNVATLGGNDAAVPTATVLLRPTSALSSLSSASSISSNAKRTSQRPLSNASVTNEAPVGPVCRQVASSTRQTAATSSTKKRNVTKDEHQHRPPPQTVTPLLTNEGKARPSSGLATKSRTPVARLMVDDAGFLLPGTAINSEGNTTVGGGDGGSLIQERMSQVAKQRLLVARVQ